MARSTKYLAAAAVILAVCGATALSGDALPVRQDVPTVSPFGWLYDSIQRIEERQRTQGEAIARIDERTQDARWDAGKIGASLGIVAGFLGALAQSIVFKGK